MDFSEALKALKDGRKLTRKTWNGKGQFLYFVPGGNYAAQTEIAKKEFAGLVPYRAYIAIKTVQGNVVPWVASQSDLLEDDWEIVE